ncbi:MAG: sigma-E processing peptidase SpoIIGA [Clostridiales bacterium]|nr:sigma-E processing peptidase SpoIIGA [Candidatus Apopatousia equi]
MEIYIEYVIIDNMVIDSIILSLTSKFNRINLPFYKILLIALFGTTLSLLSPLISGIWLVFYKILTGLVMPMFLCLKSTFKKYIITLLTFWLVSMSLAGGILAFCSIFGIKYITSNGAIEIYNFPVGLILLITTAIYFVLKNLINHFYNQKHLEKFIYTVEFNSENSVIGCKAFLDTGNKIMDETTGKPVNLINIDMFSKLFPNVKLSDILLKRYDKIKLKNLHEIEIKSLTKSSKILVFEIDNIEIKEINKNLQNVLFGLSTKDFKSNLNADLILNPVYFE